MKDAPFIWDVTWAVVKTIVKIRLISFNIYINYRAHGKKIYKKLTINTYQLYLDFANKHGGQRQER